ncbi:PTPRM-like protein [Mya arenaria]|uniref:protein-tyrosine-phosphatase n=1 Tax=Mya arenaria TaxID=6604 RepID=A0ABY7FQV7_MYAAR|nr:PTPRM-like protein [Mya arenaria]
MPSTFAYLSYTTTAYFPDDETRVVLQKYGNHINDYINANYIHGYNQMRAYIASQGPTKDILVDFWRMVWQLRVGKVVMLTNLEEDKKMKCMQYWPDADSVDFDDYKVTILGTEYYSAFIIRTLAVEKAGEENRQLVHFHFTAWPDKKVPKYASSLVHFRHKVETTAVKENGPIIVHCSAGVGRTGTFIALNVLTEQALSMGYVDPVGCVNTLRRQRVDMIQTPDQYIFLHMALLETLMLSTSALSASQFLAAYKELMAFGNDHRRRKIDVEFSRMEKMSPVADERQYVSAKEVRNRNKNRYTNILPVADHMPYLTPSGMRSEPDYINAVFLPNYKKKGAFIITQTPLKVTKTDFWRMVVEHDVHTIVMMNNRSEMKEDEIFWPENEDHMLNENMTIGKTGEECKGGLRKITLDLNRFGKTRKLQLIQFEGWPNYSALPSSPKDIINLFDAVQYWQHQSGNNPVLVHCMNGADRSGLFCVVSAVLERMKIEQDVAITQVIKEMRNYREQIVPSLCRCGEDGDIHCSECPDRASLIDGICGSCGLCEYIEKTEGRHDSNTGDQYIFLHMALLETLMLSTSALSASQFLAAYKELMAFGNDHRRRKIDVEFSRMEKMSPVADERQYVSAKEVRNRNKNRYTNILPVADHMPYLTPSGMRSEPDYINAVFLPNYKKKGAFIITQTPLKVTKTDFWRMVVEHDVHTIVMMNNRSEMKEDEIFWPENEDHMLNENMTIGKTGEECKGGLRKITLDLNRFGKTRKLQLIQFEGWPNYSALPSSPKDIINLFDAVQYWQHQSGNNPVLVHCMNGADRSGLFCVVSAVLERMKIEQDVAITQVIKEMRNYREQIVPSLDQFQFVHEVIKEYILQNETYSNFTD